MSVRMLFFFLLQNFFRQLSSNDIVEAIDYDEAIVAIKIYVRFFFKNLFRKPLRQ